MTTAIGYIRTSFGYPHTAQQQEQIIRDHAAQIGIAVHRFFRDDGRHRLRARDTMLRTLTSGLQIVIITSPCRLSPDLPSMIRTLTTIREAGARMVIASDDPMATEALEALIMGIPALIAARQGMRIEAAAAGRERARARGIRLGRPPVPVEKVERVRAALADGIGVRSAARLAGVSPASVIRLRSAMASLEHGPCETEGPLHADVAATPRLSSCAIQS